MSFVNDPRVSWTESWGSRATNLQWNTGSQTREYVVEVVNYNDAADAADALALNHIRYNHPATFYWPDPLYVADYVFGNRQFDLDVISCLADTVGHKYMFRIRVTYQVIGRQDTFDESFTFGGEASTLYDALDSREYEVKVDTATGQCTVQNYGVGEEGNVYQYRINVQEDVAEGIEIISPYGQYTRRYVFTKTAIGNLACWTRERMLLFGSVNNAQLGAFCKGELRFERMEITETEGDDISVTFVFGVRPGRQITFKAEHCAETPGEEGEDPTPFEFVVNKYGWEYVWVKYNKSQSQQLSVQDPSDQNYQPGNSEPAKVTEKIDRVVRQQIYPFADFNYILSAYAQSCDSALTCIEDDISPNQ